MSGHTDYDVDSEDELRRLIDSGQALAGLIIPPDYSTRIAGGETAQVAMIVDGSDPTVASTALSAATMIGQTKSTNILAERAAGRSVETGEVLAVAGGISSEEVAGQHRDVLRSLPQREQIEFTGTEAVPQGRPEITAGPVQGGVGGRGGGPARC